MADFVNGGSGYLGVGAGGRRSAFPSPASEMPPALGTGQGGYSAWGENRDESAGEAAGGEEGDQGDEVGELLNPMAALSFGGQSAPPSSQASYAPKLSQRVQENDDEDDLGFGNAGLSRNKPPRPTGGDAEPEPGDAAGKKGPESKADKGGKKDESAPSTPSKEEAAKAAGGGWFKGWFGKKEGEAAGSGPIRAKLGEENAMVFDKELRRWVVKGVSQDWRSDAKMRH